MWIFNYKVDLNNYLKHNNLNKTSIGFVPTMGALHKGHLSLLEKSVESNVTTVISIFVNPTQFNNEDDLKKYPRTLEDDVEKIKTISDKIIIYAPSVEDIYEDTIKPEHYNFDGLEHQMEGKFRPGHFDGVGTVVKRLFEIIKPNNAYFGEKDFQQLQIIKKLVEKEKTPINIIGCPILREDNGLAMSSRNERLSVEEKEKSDFIFKTLSEAKKLFGIKSAKKTIAFVYNKFEKNSDFELEYFEIADEASLLPCIRKNKNKKYRAFIAVFVNKIRLIDTISLN
jgi:pantoate--beta-alanine ligase